MANSTDRIIVEEGPRNAIVRLTGFLDTSDVSLIPAFSLSDFSNNDVRVTLTGFRIDQVDFDVSSDLIVILEWSGNSPQPIGNFADANKVEWRSVGGLQPNQQAGGYNGGINLRTSGFLAGSKEAYTITLRMVKLYRV